MFEYRVFFANESLGGLVVLSRQNKRQGSFYKKEKSG